MCKIKPARKKPASVIYLSGFAGIFGKTPANLTSVPAPVSPENATGYTCPYLYCQATTTAMILVFTTTALFFTLFFWSVDKLNRTAEQEASHGAQPARSFLKTA
jgi:hypothetical protein